MVSDVLERAREEGEERWDDDFADGISFSKFGMSPSSSAFFSLFFFSCDYCPWFFVSLS